MNAKRPQVLNAEPAAGSARSWVLCVVRLVLRNSAHEGARTVGHL